MNTCSLIDSLCIMFSVSKNQLNSILQTDEAYFKAMYILRQVELRSKCEPKKSIYPTGFTLLHAQEILTDEYQNLEDYYAKKFAFTLDDANLLCLIATTDENEDDYVIYPLEVMYISRN